MRQIDTEEINNNSSVFAANLNKALNKNLLSTNFNANIEIIIPILNTNIEKENQVSIVDKINNAIIAIISCINNIPMIILPCNVSN